MGFPQVTEIWFLHADDELKLSLNTARLKTRNLEKRPKCSLQLLDLEKSVSVPRGQGHARIEPDDDYAFERRGLAPSTAARMSASTTSPETARVVVTIEPTNVYAVDMSG